MVREDLVTSAVSFLQDPSVAASALDKRIAFLQSKNLTQEEIDVSLARAGDVPQASNTAVAPPPSSQYSYQAQLPSRQPAGYGYGYGPYSPWAHAPPEPPRRDWRDWFIMATVTSGVGYGLYTVAKRYVLPLISPPTPPQLESDKASIDASFLRAFALIDQLTADTATLKEKETQRTEKLDIALKDVNIVVEDLKAANLRREADSRIVVDQINGLKEQVPKALEGWKANGDAKLEELSQEMQSLKRLLENRVGRSGGTSTPQTVGSETANANGTKYTQGYPSPSGPSNPESSATTSLSSSAPAPGVTAPKQESSTHTSSPPTQRNDRKAIPAWQRAATEKSTAEAGA